MSTEEVRILPTEWVGSSTSTTWGMSTKHHPKHSTHGHLEPEMQMYSVPMTVRIIRQEGRHVELVFTSDNHEAQKVGLLSADGTKLLLASAVSNDILTIDGDTMHGDTWTRPHGSDRAGEVFGVHMWEFMAKS